MSKNEVAQLRERIEAECAAMRLDLNGLAAGTARHQFIEAKTKRAGGIENQLASYREGEQALLFSHQASIRVMEGNNHL